MNRSYIDTNFFLTLTVCFGLLSAIALPSVPLGGLSLYLVTLLFPFVFFINFSFFLKKPLIHYSVLFVVFLGAMVVWSSMYSWAFGFSFINSRDIVESIKYIQFIPYLLAIPFLKTKSLDLFHSYIMASSVIVSLVGILQVFGYGDYLSSVYLGPDSSHIDSMNSRITVTGSNPNDGAVISCFFCIYFFSVYAVRRKLIYLFVSLFFLFILFKTQGRTALVALVFSLGFYYFFYFKSYLFIKFIVGSFFLISIVFLIFYLDLSYIYIGFDYAIRGENNSLNVRFENIKLAYDLFLESPYFGMGPGKSNFTTVIDSEYALILQRYGLLGVLIFSSYLAYLARLSHRNLESHWGISLLSFTLLSLVVMFTNNIFSGYQLMSIVVILNIACVLNERSKYRIKKETSV